MAKIMARGSWGIGALAVLLMVSVAAGAADEKGKAKAKVKKPAGPAVSASGPKVSYDKQIRPILQAQCQGCHQPAKAGGGYVMTAFDRMLKGGESDMAAIVPGKPDESYLIDKITPEDGKAEMPQDKPPLSTAEIELIGRWIAQGAADDTPQTAKARYDMDHPPEYTRLPVIPAPGVLARWHRSWPSPASTRSCSGRPTAPSWSAGWSGLSERIESLAFSPDGKKLAVTGGRPARMGEVQVWDVAKRKLAALRPGHL